MSEGKHAPLPWHVNHDRPYDGISQISISNGDTQIIANVVTYKRTHGVDGGAANAAFIVRAVNSHDALVKALTDMLIEFGGRQHKDCDCNACKVVRRACDILAAAAPPVESKSEVVDGYTQYTGYRP